MTMCLPLFTVALAASVPSAPRSLTAVAGDGQIALVWFAPENDGGAAITGYQVSIDGGDTWTDTGLVTSITYTGLAGGKLYTFMVRAMNSAGAGEEAIATSKPAGGGTEATPTPTDEPASLFDSYFSTKPTPTPEAGGTGAGLGVGQGTGGGGGGQQLEPPKPPDMPNPPPKPQDKPQDEPQDEPPPQVEPPQPEDYLPVEIDPADVTERPFRPKRAQIKKLRSVWKITASGTRTRYGDNSVKWVINLDFRATKVGGDISGVYTGNGMMNREMDQAYWQGAGHPYGEWVIGGPLTNISFALLTPLLPIQPSANSGSGLQPLPPIQPAKNSGSGLQPLLPIQPAENSNAGLQPLPPIQPESNSGTGLQPLPPIQPSTNSGGGLQPLPPLNPMPPAQATGSGTMFWNCSNIQHLFLNEAGGILEPVHTSPESLPCEVIIYTNGNGIVKVQVGPWSLVYKARLVKSVTLVNVK